MNITTLDIISIVLVIGLGFIGYAKGAINTLIGLVGVVASFLIARVFSPMAASWFLGLSSVQRTINSTITDTMNSAIQDYSAEMVSNIPSIPGMESLSTIINNAVSSMAPSGTDAAVAAVAAAVNPVIHQLLSMIMFVILFLLCLLFFNVIKGIGRGINRVPVLGVANRLGGMAIGMLIGGMVMWVTIYIVYSFSIFTGDTALGASLQSGLITGPMVSVLV